jgi:predicted AlkP superfamily phosphohydrolase/phosphomutase
MTGGAAALTVCAGLCVVLVVIHRWSGRRSTRTGAVVLGVTIMASLAVPLTLRGPGIGRPAPARIPDAVAGAESRANDSRVTLLLFEGASLDIIVPAAANGRLPHFARMLDEGASLHMATLRPTQPSTVWTAAATGKLPYNNGIRSAATYFPFATPEGLEVLPDFCFVHALVRFGFLRQQMHSSRDLTAWPLWSILATQGVTVGVVNWAVTHPARRVTGYLVSDQVDRWRQSIDLEGADAIWPKEASDTVAAAAASVSAPDERTPVVSDDETGDRVMAPCQADRTFERIAEELDRQMPARFRAVRFECLDAVGHYYLRYTMPAAFGDVSDEELQRFAGVLPAQYAVADGIVGRELAALRPGDLLLVASGFGVEPIDPIKRLLDRAFGDPEVNGTHEHAPDGFFMAFGTQVKPGHYLRGSIIDVAPTVLYYLGLPVGRDMDGFARTDVFQSALTDARPITFIPSYER